MFSQIENPSPADDYDPFELEDDFDPWGIVDCFDDIPDDSPFDPFDLAVREQTNDERYCGTVREILITSDRVIHAHSFCRKPWCPHCGPGVQKYYPRHAKHLLSTVERVWVTCMSDDHATKVASLTQRIRRRGASYFQVQMDNEDRFFFVSKDPYSARAKHEDWSPSSAADALALFVRLLKRKPPDVALARKPSASDDWTFPDPLNPYPDSVVSGPPSDDWVAPIPPVALFVNVAPDRKGEARERTEQRFEERTGQCIPLDDGLLLSSDDRQTYLAVAQEVVAEMTKEEQCNSFGL